MPFNYLWSLLVMAWLLLVPTNITGISSDTTVLEGDNLQLTCKALGRPEPIITWTVEKLGNQGNTGVVQEGEVLTITNINRNDSGTFTCTADNGFGKPEKRTVHVNVTREYTLKNVWIMLNRDALSFYFCVTMYCAVNYLDWCLANYIHAGLQAQTFKKSSFSNLQF